MRSLSGTKHPDKPYDPLIVHPDIRRMLLTQKCIAEGGRSMIYECALLNDESMEAEAVGDTATVKAIDDRMGFLTPILKVRSLRPPSYAPLPSVCLTLPWL